MKTLVIFLLALFPIVIFAQDELPVFKINYDQIENGEKSNDSLSFLYHNQIAFLSEADEKIRQFIDFKTDENVSTIVFDDQLYKNATPFSELPEPTFKDKNQEILGYQCQYALYSYFSNSIEVWFTTETIPKGSPYSRFLPYSGALVLKIVINGNREIIATSIEELTGGQPPEYIAKSVVAVTDAEFEELKINSRFTRLHIFDEQIVNFDPSIKPAQYMELDNDTTYRFSKGSVIMKKIKLTDELLNSGHVFAELNCKSNGDAYDRTGSVFIVPAKYPQSVLTAYQFGLDTLPVFTDNEDNKYQGIRQENGYRPPIEIMRFFTSFGANHFNEKRAINNYPWAEDVLFKQEITPLIPLDEEEVWVGVFIGNYDKGGHIVSLDLCFHPGFGDEDEKTGKYIQPLFSTINTLEMSGQNYGKLFGNDTLEVKFEIDENLENLQLWYTTTGHGGWGGGDEFNPKLNQVFVDGEEVFKVIPWRTDCASYRFSNPASGNFGNGISSSDLSRSNWCPGTLTPPYIVSLNQLKPGKHTMEIVIDQGENEGGSFSHWGVTGVLTAEIKTIE